MKKWDSDLNVQVVYGTTRRRSQFCLGLKSLLLSVIFSKVQYRFSRNSRKVEVSKVVLFFSLYAIERQVSVKINVLTKHPSSRLVILKLVMNLNVAQKCSQLSPSPLVIEGLSNMTFICIFTMTKLLSYFF